MTRKFVKKPIEVEAFQFGFDYFPEWFQPGPMINYSTKEHCAHIHTPDGIMTAQIGDYIIKGVKGEIYPCKEDVFNLTYEEVLSDYAKTMIGFS